MIVKLGKSFVTLREQPLNPPIKMEKTLLKEEVERLRNQVDAQSALTELLENVKTLNKKIEPINKALSGKIERKKKVDKDADFIKKFRASQLLK